MKQGCVLAVMLMTWIHMYVHVCCCCRDNEPQEGSKVTHLVLMANCGYAGCDLQVWLGGGAQASLCISLPTLK